MKYKFILPLLLLMTFFGFAHGQDLKAESSSTHSTEPAGPGDVYYNEAAFLDRLKKLVRGNDKRTIAYEMVYYPFIWQYWTPEGKKRLRPFYSPEDFIQHYDKFMTSAHKKGLLEEASRKDHCIGSNCYLASGLFYFYGKSLTQVNHWENHPPKKRPHDIDPSLCTICDCYPDKELIAYFDRLKKALREDDRKTIAEDLVSYPFTWRTDNWDIVYEPREFIAAYDKIVRPFFKNAILNFQYKLGSCSCTSDNDAPWEIVDGRISFNKEGLESFFQPPEYDLPLKGVPNP